MDTTLAEERKLTWRELKALIESAGIKDEDEIDNIEISWGNPQELLCVKDEIFGWRITL